MRLRTGRLSEWSLAISLLAVGVFLYAVRQIILPFVVAAALAYVFSPGVGWLERRLRIPRPAVVALFYLAVFLPLGALGLWLAPALARETADLVANAPTILTDLLNALLGGEEAQVLGQNFRAAAVAGFLLGSVRDFLGAPQEAIHLASVALGLLFSSFLSLVLLFYLLVDGERFGRFALSLLAAEDSPRVKMIASQVNLVLGRYLRGVMLLILFMSVATWLGLALLFDLPYALPIAVATGFLELIPLIGPIAAGAIAGIVALSHGGTGSLIGVVVFYTLLRQLEDHVIGPLVLGRVVELHPVVIIFAVLAGGVLAGLIGVVLAVPVAAALKVLLEHWLGVQSEG